MLPGSAIHPPGRSTSCARRQPTDGSTQCQDAAATRTSKRRPPSSHSSNFAFSTATLRKAASRWRPSAAMPAPASTAVTAYPSAPSERVAWPVPQPTSSTGDPLSRPVMAARSANSSSG
jgi:hypothetical protein